MRDRNKVRLLQRLGFGGYEARAYLALLQGAQMTGYELAEQMHAPLHRPPMNPFSSEATAAPRESGEK